jgi:hypothetical protein
MVNCKSCGEKDQEGKFCRKCGSRLQAPGGDRGREFSKNSSPSRNDDETDIPRLKNRAKEALRQQDYEHALKLLVKVAKVQSDDASVWNNIGIVYTKLGNKEKAVRAFDRALSIDDEVAQIWYGKGYVLFENREYKDALIAFKKALRIDPDNSKYKGKYRECEAKIDSGSRPSRTKDIIERGPKKPKIAWEESDSEDTDEEETDEESAKPSRRSSVSSPKGRRSMDEDDEYKLEVKDEEYKMPQIKKTAHKGLSWDTDKEEEEDEDTEEEEVVKPKPDLGKKTKGPMGSQVSGKPQSRAKIEEEEEEEEGDEEVVKPKPDLGKKTAATVGSRGMGKPQSSARIEEEEDEEEDGSEEEPTPKTSQKEEEEGEDEDEEEVRRPQTKKTVINNPPSETSGAKAPADIRSKPASEPKVEKKETVMIYKRIKCPECKGVIDITTNARPVVIQCPYCLARGELTK